jgi:phosphoglycerate kinase
MRFNTVRDADVTGKRVLVRVDFNVPLKDGSVVDETRIKAAMPTVAHLLGEQAVVVLCSHLGRPKGKVVDEFSMRPVYFALQEILNAYMVAHGGKRPSVMLLNDCVGDAVRYSIGQGQPGQVFLLENTRFHPGEEANERAFAEQLARNADLYVSDAFGAVHRAHASTEGVAHLLPSYAGLLVEKEVKALGRVVHEPEHPLAIVLGGAKISGKIEVLENLIPLADMVLIGGAMANTFVKAQGHPTGKSLVEDDMLDTARAMLRMAEERDTRLVLPQDYVVTDNLDNPQQVRTVSADSIGDNELAVDIGEETRNMYRRELKQAKTIFWNGPMGVFEMEQFATGTRAIATALAEAEQQAFTVIGGGESVTAVNQAGVEERIGHISTGGGASLEFVAGRSLPGLEVLRA